MAATTAATAHRTTARPTHRRPHRTATTVVLHGIHPLRGYPVTWHVTPLDAPGTTTAFLVERADGHLAETSWAAAEKETALMDVDGVRRLVRASDGRR